jgi:hypothetical protein
VFHKLLKKDSTASNTLQSFEALTFFIGSVVDYELPSTCTLVRFHIYQALMNDLFTAIDDGDRFGALVHVLAAAAYTLASKLAAASLLGPSHHANTANVLLTMAKVIADFAWEFDSVGCLTEIPMLLTVMLRRAGWDAAVAVPKVETFLGDNSDDEEDEDEGSDEDDGGEAPGPSTRANPSEGAANAVSDVAICSHTRSSRLIRVPTG